MGLHTGAETVIHFKPALENAGISFRRIDKPGFPPLPADSDHVWNTNRGTNLGDSSYQIHTTEHVLAAIHGLNIDNLLIEIEGSEPPVTDGSSLAFVEVLEKAGIVEQDARKKFFRLKNPVYHSENGVELVYLPSDRFIINFTIQFSHPYLTSDNYTVQISSDTFRAELASARTFCFVHEVELLRTQGLIKGGSLENAIVIGDEGILNRDSLRFENEFVRHKILDLVGDLVLIGQPVRGKIIAIKSGHSSNIHFVKKLQEARKKEREEERGSTCILDIRDIQNILPHRYPFLLIDRILTFEEKHRIVGIKNFTVNEPFFNGHFPGFPITPGVIIVEAMAQCGGVLLLKSYEQEEDFSNKQIWFLGIDRAKFRKPVIPGDQVRFEVTAGTIHRKTCKMKARAYVDGKLVAEAELLATITEKGR
jgi:UDP-3-O-[3-hydroxymyristoyl] N-acetylglucosamine deacetylase/3-hydroxyacyl-[acyl-carrier-protein] dehydratase